MLSNYVIWMNIRRWHCDTNKWKIVERSSVKIGERLGRQWRRHFYEPDNDDGDKCMNFYSPCSFICIKLYSRKIFIISFQIRSETFFFRNGKSWGEFKFTMAKIKGKPSNENCAIVVVSHIWTRNLPTVKLFSIHCIIIAIAVATLWVELIELIFRKTVKFSSFSFAVVVVALTWVSNLENCTQMRE